MIRKELIAAAAEKSGKPQNQISEALKAIEAVIVETLAQGGSVSLANIGTLRTADRAARQARNPRTGKTVTLPACKTVKFKASKLLKNTVNSGK